MRFKNDRRLSAAVIIGIVAVVILLGVAGYFAKSYFDLRANPGQAAQEDTKRLTDQVGKLYALPDEDPVVGKIQDREKLSDQEFFKNAANGDDLLIYQESKLAIIYRASENKLINVGPVSINNTDADQPGVDTEAQSEESGRGE